MHALSFVLLGAGLLMVAILCFYIALNIRMYAGYGSLLGIPPNSSSGVSVSISIDNDNIKEGADGGGGGFDKSDGGGRGSCKKRIGGDRVQDKGDGGYMKGGGVMKGYCDDVGRVEGGLSDKKVVVCSDGEGESGSGGSDTC